MLKPRDLGEALARVGSVLASMRDLIGQECLLLERRRDWITQVCDDFNLMCKESRLLTAGQSAEQSGGQTAGHNPATATHPPEPLLRAELDRVLRRLSSVHRVAGHLAEERKALHATIQSLTGTLERLEEQLAAAAEETSLLAARAGILES